ncbi:putative gnat family acetyltransferase protein [Phaeoacremonium minimum UCRPA7]|uniref:N-alpha-acetyltransferase 40 n=1 Tax=Phaeoacremonium minimum (strain UCR-PA7) TaxID=1286976 RepID=R8BSM4_PHAM7|nr:putative gnat family acetyltransferase protein [Phaeoacremonium minimum UCRPA7]EOO02362.1 putative gnat family acetyltransferase protein [Phaeoacremonium minimum UCRPA7]
MTSSSRTTSKDWPSWSTTWIHPKTQAVYHLSLSRSKTTSEDDLSACFNLVEETSRNDYENSSMKWQPDNKAKEMRSEDLRYILVKDAAASVRGFISLMPTFEAGQPVVYCYEIHLKPELRGTGMAALLMGFLCTVAESLPPINKVMLTCFLSNKKALAFYRKAGFVTDEISPRERKLRFGKIFVPDYVIMSKLITHQAQQQGSLEGPNPSSN